MKPLPRYTLVIGSIVIALFAVAAPFLDDAGRFGLVVAAGVALPLQVGLFALLIKARNDPSRFIAFWGFGVLGRMVVLAVVSLSIRSSGIFDPSVTIISTVGLMFIFLLLEPVCLRRNDQVTAYAR